MLTDHSRQLLAHAATESIERIRSDRARAPQRLKPLLAYIENNLFDATLDVNQLKRRCGVRDNSVPIQFHSAVGRPPHGYIEDRRLETACRLLSDTNLKIWQISELLGYSSIQVFSRAFSRWSGQRPTQFRKKARMRQAEESADGANGAIHNGAEKHFFFGPDALRKALAGEMSHDEASALISRLVKLYPGSRRSAEGGESREDSGDPRSKEDDQRGFERSPSPLAVATGSSEAERQRAEDMLRGIESMPPEERQEFLANLDVGSPALFHLLCERSREASRQSPAEGIQLAELALQALDRIIDLLHGRRLASLRGQGRAWLANAHLASANYNAAEAELETAEKVLVKSDHEPCAVGDIHLVKAALRRDQRQFAESQQLLIAATEAYGRGDCSHRLSVVRIAQAALHAEEGNLTSAITCLEQAMADVEGEDETLRLSLMMRLISLLVDADEPARAAELLSSARELALASGERHDRIRLRWIEGVVHRQLGRFAEAEAALEEAREAFGGLDKPIDAALAVIDLAELYSREGRLAELESLAGTMVPLFGRLEHHGDALVAVQEAAAGRSVTDDLLQDAREALHGSAWRRAA